MITTKKSFKRSSVERHRNINQKVVKHVRKPSSNMNKPKKTSLAINANTVGKEDNTKRANKKKVKSADKFLRPPKQRLVIRKKSQDQTRPTIKQKVSSSFKQQVKNFKSKKREKEEEDQMGKKKHLSMEGIVKTNKYNILKKHKTKATNNSKQKSRFLDKSQIKTRPSRVKRNKVRKASLRSFSGEKVNDRKERNKANLKKLSKAKSVKLLKMKRSVSKDKQNMKKITKKINKKINIIDKKVNYLYSNISQNKKSQKKQVKLKHNKKKNKAKIKISKNNRGSGVSLKKDTLSHLVQSEFIYSLKELTETHLLKLNQLFDNFNKTKNSEKRELESNANIKELIQITKMTIQEYQNKMKNATKIIETSKAVDKPDLQIEAVSIDKQEENHLEKFRKLKKTPKKKSATKMEKFCIFNKRNSLELKTPKINMNRDKLYSERSKNSKKEAFFSESWKLPNKTILHKNSKNLIISNITKTKNSEDNMRSFDRLRNSNVLNSNCENSDFNSYRCKSEKSLDKQRDISPVAVIDKKKEPTLIKEDDQNTEINKQEPAVEEKTDIKEPSKDKVDEISEQVLKVVVDDLFEDYLYRLFFLPDKITGIKTNYNYCKFYFDALIKLTESKLKRQIQRAGPHQPINPFRA